MIIWALLVLLQLADFHVLDTSDSRLSESYPPAPALPQCY